MIFLIHGITGEKTFMLGVERELHQKDQLTKIPKMNLFKYTEKPYLFYVFKVA
jgi:hypothetical protein